MSLEAKAAAAKSLVKEQIAAARAEDVCVTSSFQAEDMVVVHLVREVMGNVPVIFLDTGYHFAETYEYRDRLSKEWDLNLVNVLPQLTVAEQESQFGILNQTAPDRCCGLRKVGPLFASLEPYRLGSPVCGGSRQRRAQIFKKLMSLRCPRVNSCRNKSSGGLVNQGRMAVRGTARFPCYRCTKRAIPA